MRRPEAKSSRGARERSSDGSRSIGALPPAAKQLCLRASLLSDGNSTREWSQWLKHCRIRWARAHDAYLRLSSTSAKANRRAAQSCAGPTHRAAGAAPVRWEVDAGVSTAAPALPNGSSEGTRCSFGGCGSAGERTWTDPDETRRDRCSATSGRTFLGPTSLQRSTAARHPLRPVRGDLG